MAKSNLKYIGYVNNYDKNRYLEKIWKAAVHSIFKDNLVISSIPNYFNISETPINCYKYNKSIRSTLFNFNKIVTDIDIDSITPDS